MFPKDSKWPSNTIKEKWPLSLYNAAGLNADDVEANITIFNNAYSGIKERTRDMIEMYYRDKKTQPSIAEKYGVSAGYVGQLIKRGLNKLRVQFITLCNEADREKTVKSYPDMRDVPLLYTTLSNRTKNALIRHFRHKYGDPSFDKWTIQNVLDYSIEDLIEVRNFGKKSIAELIDYMDKHQIKHNWVLEA